MPRILAASARPASRRPRTRPLRPHGISGLMPVPLAEPFLIVSLLELEQGQAQLSSTVSNVRTQSRCSFSVRMNRSATPLPSGSRTNDGLDAMPKKRISS